MADELEMELDLRLYWRLFLRWFWLIALAALLAGGAAYVVSRWFIQPVYQASVQLLIQPSSSLGGTNYQDILAGQRVASTYAEILQSRPVIISALRQMGYTDEELENFDEEGVLFELSVGSLGDTQLIELKVESTNRRFAMEFANGIAKTFIEDNQNRQTARFAETQAEILEQMALIDDELKLQESQLEVTEDAQERSRLELQIAQNRDSLSRLNNAYQNIVLAKLQSLDLISVIEPARLAEKPIRPRKMVNTVLAAVVGGLVAVSGVILSEMLDTSVKSPDEAASLTGAPVLGQIWYEKDISGSTGVGPMVVLQKPLSLTAEAFRLLRANLEFVSVDTPLNVILVTSSGPTEGKSTISLNLALAMALTGRKVLLIDADMRKPRLHGYAGVDREPGLSNALIDHDADISSYLQPLPDVEGVMLMPAGKAPPNPAELLGSRRMRELIEACRLMADVVIIDSPPILAAADAAVLAPQTNGALLIIEPGSSDKKAVVQGAEQLHRSGAHLLGTVLNKVPMDNKGGYYYHYYYYYQSDEEQSKSIWDKVLPASMRKNRSSRKRRERRVKVEE